MGDWEQRNIIIREIKQGRDLARQLNIHLNAPSSSHETREVLVHKIIAIFEEMLAMLNRTTASAGEPSHHPPSVAIRMSESPSSLTGSPRSEDSDKEQELKDAPRKRMTLPRWTKHVKVTPGMGIEGTLEDGYSWRKYGQKDILGAKYPRGYYRCTHRNVQGCLATKQVQKSDDDPTLFEITYRGRHTCNRNSSNALAPSSSQERDPEPNVRNMCPDQQPQFQQQSQLQSQEILQNFRAGLTVLTENLHISSYQSLPPFQFPSSSTQKDETPFFTNSMTNENNFPENFSPYLSPATSATNCFSMSQCGNRNLPSCESEITGIVSEIAQAAPSSTTLAPQYPFGHVELDSNFTFDNSGFFS